MNDPYDSGTPKYSTATDIYEKLCEIYYNEEASILGEMFADVSYENQDYYYIDKGMKLKEKFDAVSNNGNNLWLMDLANSKLAAQNDEYHLLGDLDDWIYEAITNEDIAKRIGFKALFVKYLLFDDSSKYKDFREEFENELYELNRFGFNENKNAWQKVINAHNFTPYQNGYGSFSNKIQEKILGLHLQEEMIVIAESRAFLISYDDFILGLKINQDLYQMQERLYAQKVAELKAAYNANLLAMDTATTTTPKRKPLTTATCGSCMLRSDGGSGSMIKSN